MAVAVNVSYANRCFRQGRTDLYHPDSGLSEHKGGTVSTVGLLTSEDCTGVERCVQNDLQRTPVIDSSVDDRVKSVQKVTRDADRH